MCKNCTLKSRLISRLASRITFKIKVDFKMHQKPHFITTFSLKTLRKLRIYQGKFFFIRLNFTHNINSGFCG